MSRPVPLGISAEHHADVSGSDEKRRDYGYERDGKGSEHLIPLVGFHAGDCPAHECMQANADAADQQKKHNGEAGENSYGPLDGFVPAVSGLSVLHAPVGYHDARSTGNGRLVNDTTPAMGTTGVA